MTISPEFSDFKLMFASASDICLPISIPFILDSLSCPPIPRDDILGLKTISLATFFIEDCTNLLLFSIPLDKPSIKSGIHDS